MLSFKTMGIIPLILIDLPVINEACVELLRGIKDNLLSALSLSGGSGLFLKKSREVVLLGFELG